MGEAVFLRVVKSFGKLPVDLAARGPYFYYLGKARREGMIYKSWGKGPVSVHSLL